MVDGLHSGSRRDETLEDTVDQLVSEKIEEMRSGSPSKYRFLVSGGGWYEWNWKRVRERVELTGMRECNRVWNGERYAKQGLQSRQHESHQLPFTIIFRVHLLPIAQSTADRLVCWSKSPIFLRARRPLCRPRCSTQVAGEYEVRRRCSGGRVRHGIRGALAHGVWGGKSQVVDHLGQPLA